METNSPKIVLNEDALFKGDLVAYEHWVRRKDYMVVSTTEIVYVEPGTEPDSSDS